MTLPRHFFQRIPLFIVTIPLFVVIHTKLEYGRLIVFSTVATDILLLFLPAVLIFFITLLLWRNVVKAGVFSVLLLLFYYFFADLKDWLWQLYPQHVISSYLFLLPTCAVLLVLLLIGLIRMKKPPVRSFAFFNMLFLLFIAYDVLTLAFSGNRLQDLGDPHKQLSGNYTPCDTCHKPDIYYIVLDGYTASTTLQDHFGYNNASLDSFLQQKQFYIVQHSTSNYNLTPFSISATFNLNYLTRLNTSKDFYMKEYMPGVETVYKNELFPLLKKEGYHVINNSIFDIDQAAPLTPYNNEWGIDKLFKRHHFFYKIIRDIGWKLHLSLFAGNVEKNYRNETTQLSRHVKSVTSNLDTIVKGPKTAPVFVYSHLLLPHNPFIFDSAGNVIPVPASSADKNRYIQQLQYTNTLIREMTNTILSDTTRSVVIILQGDHGFRFWHGKEKTEFSNLNAFYFSNKNYGLLYDSITNVNTFRVVCNTFFKQHLPLLPDTSYFLQYR